MIVIFFILGLFIGSFLNVVIDRLPRKETITRGRSHCEFCRHTLAWYDLVPIVSYVILRGRCRYCHKFIGWKYPIIELTTGLIFAGADFALGFSQSPLLLLYLGVISCLIIIFYIDLFDGIIPDSMLVILFALSVIIHALTKESFLNPLSTGLLTGLAFLSLFLLTRKKGIGFGDVKYAFLMGFLLGFPHSIPALYIAFLTGAIVALILVIARRKSFKSSIPFGPFLVIGTFINLLFGQQLWIFFQKLLGI